MNRSDGPGVESLGEPDATKGASCPSCKGYLPASLARATARRPVGALRRELQLALALALVALCVLGLIALSNTLAPSQPRGPDTVSQQDAGTIQDVHLQSAALSSETTVRTSLGIYQVRGGVSAAIGDATTLRRTTNEIDGKPFRDKLELCVESKIKSSCYELL